MANDQERLNRILCLLQDENSRIGLVALEAYYSLIQEIPQFIDQDFLLELFLDESPDLRSKVLEIFAFVLKNAPQSFNMTPTANFSLSSEPEDSIIQAFEILIETSPELARQCIERVVELLSDSDANVRDASVKALEIILSKSPQLIEQVDGKQLIDLLLSQEGRVGNYIYKTGFEVLDVLIRNGLWKIYKPGFKRLFKLLLGGEGEIAFYTIKALLEKVPKLIDHELINSFFETFYPTLDSSDYLCLSGYALGFIDLICQLILRLNPNPSLNLEKIDIIKSIMER